MDNSLAINSLFFNLVSENKIQKLKTVMMSMDQVECPVHHHFSPGLYTREVSMPAGSVVMGYRQLTHHLNIFIKGRIAIVTDKGDIEVIQAPMIYTGTPGRKIGYMLEDVVWLNVYSTDETDIETLENTFIDKSGVWTEEDLKQIAKLQYTNENISDYNAFLAENNLIESEVRKKAEVETHLIPFPLGSYSVGIFNSGIEGKGLFATASFKVGDRIVPARLGGDKTPAERYTNHSKRPNAKLVKIGQGTDLYLVAIRPIKGCRGGLLGDEILIDYRKTFKMQESLDIKKVLKGA